MKFSLQKFEIFLGVVFLIASTVGSGAFALLGPVQPWMQMTNGVINPGDIGGPMCISNGYRWNVPVVTYGFDQSFLNYFGSNGVAAVESAIQILNDLPPASQIALTNYAPWMNATIQSYGIPQDQAAEANAAASLQDIATTNFPTAGTNFTYSFPPLSLTLFTFAPGPSALSVLGVQPGQVELLLQGQPGTPFVIQSSPDLMAWTSVSTNALVGSALNITIPVAAGSPQQFYRAVWQP